MRPVFCSGHRLQFGHLAASAGPAHHHPELVADESATAAPQDRRAAHPPCPVLHPAAGREPIDATLVRADPRVHRATRVAPDLIVVRNGSESMKSEVESTGVSLKGTTGVRRTPKCGRRWRPRTS